jgi:hypothetical protein
VRFGATAPPPEADVPRSTAPWIVEPALVAFEMRQSQPPQNPCGQQLLPMQSLGVVHCTSPAHVVPLGKQVRRGWLFCTVMQHVPPPQSSLLWQPAASVPEFVPSLLASFG